MKSPASSAPRNIAVGSSSAMSSALSRQRVPLTQAAHHVVPVAVTAAEQVERLRAWASGRCLDASASGVYRREGDQPARPGRWAGFVRYRGYRPGR